MKACHAAILQQTETPKAAIVVQIWQGLSLTMNKTLPGEAMDEDVRGGNVAITARPCHTTSASITTEENELRYEQEEVQQLVKAIITGDGKGGENEKDGDRYEEGWKTSPRQKEGRGVGNESIGPGDSHGLGGLTPSEFIVGGTPPSGAPWDNNAA